MYHWTDFVGMSNEELGKIDIAEVHLTCAVGLPNTVPLDIPSCLAKLDAVAKSAREFTERLRSRYENNRDRFTYSPEYFRMMTMIMHLEEVLGVRSDDRLNNSDDYDASDMFLHGILAGKAGNCSGIPMLYAAIGRRLGYPLKLVATARHQFARWDDHAGARFNIECCPRGLNTPGDDHYRTFPVPVTQAQIDAGCWLKSHTPREELSGFLIQRAYCFLHNDRHREAVDAVVGACCAQPDKDLNITSAKSILRKWEAKLSKKIPPHFPDLAMHPLPERRFPKQIPYQYERAWLFLECLEKVLDDDFMDQEWWQQLRKKPKQRPSNVPTRIDIRLYDRPLLKKAIA